MRLPSLKGARVVAGRGALKRTVTGITVLEFTQPGKVLDSLYQYNAPYIEGQFCITGFAGAATDVDRQCDNLRKLAAVGVVGLALYYVGVFMPGVDERLIRLADELNMALLVMPEGRYDLRYADVISDVMKAIFLDRMQSDNITGEVVRRMMELPPQLRTLQSVLHLLCQWAQVSLVLTDAEMSPLCESVWPRQAISVAGLLTQENAPREPMLPEIFAPVPDSYIWYVPIQPAHGDTMRLYLIDVAQGLQEGQVRSIAEALQLAADLWNHSSDAPMTTALIQAILNDEPIKMRRLAAAMGIDIAAIHTMWTVRTNSRSDELTQRAVATAQDLLRCISGTALVDLYRGNSNGAPDLVAFFERTNALSELGSYARELVERLNRLCAEGVTLTMTHYSRTTADVRAAFGRWDEYEADARAILPGRSVLTDSDISFAKRCREVIRLGERSIARTLAAVEALRERKQPEEYLQTLAVYLLDAHMNMQITADKLYIHKNTVKYRLKQCADSLGFLIGEMPATDSLYLAFGVQRLLEGGK